MNNQLQTQTNNSGALIASTVDRKAMENLLPEERKIIEAALQPGIKRQKPINVAATLIAIISATYTRAGFKMPDDKLLAAYADEFYKALLERYPATTLVEIREALKAGVYGEAGEFTGLNPKTFMQFIRHYRNTDMRKVAFEMFESKKNYLLQQQKLSPEEREQSNRSLTNELFSDYLKGKLVADYVPTFVYDILEKEGLLKLTRDQKDKIKDRATAYYNQRRVSKRYKGNVKSLGDELTAFVAAQSPEVGVVIVCKQFSVCDFFEDMKNAGKTNIFSNPKLLK